MLQYQRSADGKTWTLCGRAQAARDLATTYGSPGAVEELSRRPGVVFRARKGLYRFHEAEMPSAGSGWLRRTVGRVTRGKASPRRNLQVTASRVINWRRMEELAA